MGQEEVPSFADWLAWAEDIAYGFLKLMPEQFYSITPMELDRMTECRFKQQRAERWERAYWVSCMMSVHTKHAVKTEKLMRPFMPQKTSAELVAERDAFFTEFKMKGDESDGNNR